MPDPRPLVLFDGKCGFCRIWIGYCKRLTGDAVRYEASQDAGDRFPQISKEAFGRSVQLVLGDGEVFSGAKAVYEILRYAPGRHHLAWLYNRVPLFAAGSEAAYRLIAAHRTFFFHLTHWMFGRTIEPAKFRKVEWLFLRALSLIYFIAFLSVAVQVTGLIGSRGILPAAPFLRAVSQGLHASAYWELPTVFWVNSSDIALKGAAIAGAVISLVLLAGFAQRACLAALFILYLSFSSAGQQFLSFQWDSLLLETGFLAIFLGWSRIVVWLFRWLLFRLMFLSGMVKLMSHDPAWRSLNALNYHYWTQPLPTPLAWYMNQAPEWFLRASTAGVFAIEIGAAFLIFFPRRVRFFAAGCLIFLQLLILLTGNYTFFNWLAISLCLFLFDDQALRGWRFPRFSAPRRGRVALALLVLIAALSGLQLAGTFWDWTPRVGARLLGLAAPFNIVNSYGLFAVMTTSREEIVVQGSNDGVNWLTYEFPYKPGDVRRAPPWVAPYQPRLDWQMWFAALSDAQSNPWFTNFMVRLLQGSPDVLSLLSRNPFPGAPPRYVRALLYDYHFTNFAERKATGNWWKRTERGQYFPAISLRDLRTP